MCSIWFVMHAVCVCVCFTWCSHTACLKWFDQLIRRKWMCQKCVATNFHPIRLIWWHVVVEIRTTHVQTICLDFFSVDKFELSKVIVRAFHGCWVCFASTDKWAAIEYFKNLAWSCGLSVLYNNCRYDCKRSVMKCDLILSICGNLC